MHRVRTAVAASVFAVASIAPVVANSPASHARPRINTRADFNGDGYSDLAVGVPLEETGATQDIGAVNVLYGSATGLRARRNQIWTQDSPHVPDNGEKDDSFGGALAAGDFNGDGYADLAIGSPFDTDYGIFGSAIEDAGAVNVLYGGPGGLSAGGAQFFTQNSPYVPDFSETGDRWGDAVVAGNFGRGPEADLAIGADVESVGNKDSAGAVTILYGSVTGLTGFESQQFTQDSPGMAGDGAESYPPQGFADDFGATLAAGNFGKTAYSDLAIGVFGENVGSVIDAGAVNVLYGSKHGLSTAGSQFWTQNSPNVKDSAESDTGSFQADEFGAGLASGNFGRGARADLAIGVPAENVAGAKDAGAVAILYGSLNGLTAAGNQLWTEASHGIADSPESSPDPAKSFPDSFGAVASGNMGKSSLSDLAIGVLGEDVGKMRDAGAIHVLYGTTNGLRAAGSRYFTQNTPGVADKSEGKGATVFPDLWGAVMTVANFGRSPYADLVAGAIGEDVGTVKEAGAVNVLYGSKTGITATGDQFWHQDSPNVKDQAEASDLFGYRLVAPPGVAGTGAGAAPGAARPAG